MIICLLGTSLFIAFIVIISWDWISETIEKLKEIF